MGFNVLYILDKNEKRELFTAASGSIFLGLYTLLLRCYPVHPGNLWVYELIEAFLWFANQSAHSDL